MSYPEDWKPRYLRHRLLYALRSALVTGAESHLRQAKHWQQKLIAEHPDDVTASRALDLLEGPAEFVGWFGAALGTLGCGADPEKLYRFALVGAGIDSDAVINKEAESYALGLVSGLLLDKRKVRNWHSRATRGETLHDILLSDVMPLRTTENKRLATSIRDAYQQKNRRVAVRVERFWSEITSPQEILLAIPDHWRQGIAYGTTEYVVLKRAGKTIHLALGVVATFTHPRSGAVFHLRSQDAAVNFKCGSARHLMFPVSAERVVLKDGMYSINSESFQASEVSAKLVKVGGLASVLCLQ